ncbi:MAG TPA: hypothetical protein VER32_10945 [Pyrinomonadaceae bacterium]|nr:hypothetical protein [Pyrinomonadaceae bacterium]
MSESDVHSFIVKLWVEEASGQVRSAVWRGYITHVPSGERRYLKDLDEITAFITPYLECIGVRVGMWGRVRRWLGRAGD